MPITTTSSRRYSFVTLIGLLLVALGLLRAALFVAHDPAFGYGDLPDLQRTTDCVGLMPLAGDPKPGEIARPPSYYQTAALNPAGCYLGSGMLLAVPVAIAYRVAFLVGHEAEVLIPLQAFGLFKLFLFTVLAMAVALALKPHPLASLVHGLMFFMIIADPVATLWLNTLYSESAALLGAYGAVAMIAVIVLTGSTQRWPWWFLGASFILLGFARDQFGFLPLLLAALATPALLRRSRRSTWTLLGIAAGIAVLQMMMAPLRPEGGGPVARVGSQTAEATTPMKALSRVLPATQATVPGYLGIAAGGAVRGVADLPPWAMSFLALLGNIPSMTYATTVMALLFCVPLAVLWMLWTAWKDPPAAAALPTVFAMLLGITGYSLLTTAFGVGITGAQRHHWLGSLATLAAVLLLPGVVWQLSSDLLRARIALAAALGVILLAGSWLVWTRGQPLAIGMADKVTEGPGRVLEVGGWALDPWEVRRVYVTVGDGHATEGTRGIERRDLDEIYPGYPGASKSGFQISIPSNAWRENQLLRVFVESRSGGVTEIDRRVVRLRP